MRRFFAIVLSLAMFTPSFVLGEDAKPKRKKVVHKTAVEEQLEKLQQKMDEQQAQIQQQQAQIQQQQSQIQLLQQGSATEAQQSAHFQTSLQQANQQAAAAQQATTDLSASVADLKTTTSQAIAVSTEDHKKVDKMLNPDAYAAKPTFIPAVAPVRVLPIDPPAKDGLMPAFRLGLVRVTPYGFIKATAAEDSSSPRGDDFPLPGFLSSDTGPTPTPEFHIKARASRFGVNYEWPDIAKNVTITGKFEIDFEGMFSRVDNRNISSIRSSAPTIRLGFVRVDWSHGPTDWFLEAGQNWTPFGSSTLPNLVESTGLGLGYGSLYERQPEMRFGFVQKLSGTLKFSPEIAIVQPAFGNLPADTVVAGVDINPGTGLGNQLGYGERQGSDANRPEIEARAVLQWQLDKAKGVAPAQIIVSGVQGRREAVVLASSVPAAYASAFPRGASVSSERWGGSIEAQLPTRFLTLTAKAYRGADLRYFFAGQLFSNFNDAYGLTGTATAASVDGSSTVVFGTNAAGQAVVAPQRPVRTNGGFLNVGLPLSRWFNANPAGRNAGWQLYFHYGLDQVEAADLYHLTEARAVSTRARSRLGAASLYYKMNPWCTFVFEQSLYTTIAIPSASGKTPKVGGVASREWNDRREEFGPVFTF